MYKQPNDYVRQCKACGEKIRLVKGAERWHAFNAAPSAEGMWRISRAGRPPQHSRRTL
ncbi:hypothetical protein CIP107514_00124 [Corynebacterium diphtheriae]|nr:hypothetical protein CIP107514_00124 [Corynebacterium diphtheriae]